MLLPTLCHAFQLSLFNFVERDCICQGATFGGHLYERIARFDLSQRTQAYALAYAMGEREVQTLVAVGSDDYQVWLDLRSTLSRQRRSTQTSTPATKKTETHAIQLRTSHA